MGKGVGMSTIRNSRTRGGCAQGMSADTARGAASSCTAGSHNVTATKMDAVNGQVDISNTCGTRDRVARGKETVEESGGDRQGCSEQNAMGMGSGKGKEKETVKKRGRGRPRKKKFVFPGEVPKVNAEDDARADVLGVEQGRVSAEGSKSSPPLPATRRESSPISAVDETVAGDLTGVACGSNRGAAGEMKTGQVEPIASSNVSVEGSISDLESRARARPMDVQGSGLGSGAGRGRTMVRGGGGRGRGRGRGGGCAKTPKRKRTGKDEVSPAPGHICTLGTIRVREPAKTITHLVLPRETGMEGRD